MGPRHMGAKGADPPASDPPRDSHYDALQGANALIIATEWNEFRSPDFDLIGQRLSDKVIFDGRNLYDGEYLASCGLQYHSIGRPANG